MKVARVICVFLVLSCSKKSSQGEDFESKINQNTQDRQNDPELLSFFERKRNPIKPRFELLPFGSVRPQGWILEMMNQDLTSGIVGNLDLLAPDILLEDDLFNTARRMSKEDIPDIKGLVLTGAAWEQSIQWWNSESYGNWIDGYVRTSFLTKNKKGMQKSKRLVEYLISTQDDDGYIGIYGPKLRYQHDGSNGELWSQATLFRMLLAYYELTGDTKVLNAVERAMNLTLSKYGPDSKSPFNLSGSFGGVTHGLMITDVCETLYRITGNKKYMDYAVFLYKDFSTYPLNRAFNDIRYEYLLQRDSLFESHAVHTYEHLRTLILTYHATGYSEMQLAFENAMQKLSNCILPSGGGIGDEWIAKKTANADETAGEFCSQFELREFFGSALQKSGQVEWADRYEKITFNTILGMRNQSGTAIAYCKYDNSYKVDATSSHGNDQRFKYSPTHTDVALCCSPNYGKHLPYFVGQQWMKTDDGFAATLYSPSELKTKFKETDLSIIQTTNYPLSDKIELTVSPSSPLELAIYLRKPSWVRNVELTADGASISLDDGFYKVNKIWEKGDKIYMSFAYDLKEKKFDEEGYFQRGPLVYAYAIDGKNEVQKSHNIASFSDYFVYPNRDDFEYFELVSKPRFKYVSESKSTGWYDGGTYLKGELRDIRNNQAVTVKLVPFGSTALRKVTFPYQ